MKQAESVLLQVIYKRGGVFSWSTDAFTDLVLTVFSHQSQKLMLSCKDSSVFLYAVVPFFPQNGWNSDAVISALRGRHKLSRTIVKLYRNMDAYGRNMWVLVTVHSIVKQNQTVLPRMMEPAEPLV